MTTPFLAVSPQTLGLSIPLVAIVLGIGLAMVALYLRYRRHKDSFALYHQERMAAIEKGVEVPPLPANLFEEGSAPYHPRRHLFKGLLWTLVGLGLGGALYATTELRYALFALILIGIGVAHLIYYAVEGKKEAEALDAAAAQAAANAK